MHLHFVQSLETLQGGGLGASALSLHLSLYKLQPQASRLLTTCSPSFKACWPGVVQGVRRGPEKFFYAPELKEKSKECLAQAHFFHAHGLYAWTNWWLGGEARRREKTLVCHPHGFFDPWILRRSKKKKLLAHWLFENSNLRHTSWWRALTSKEADQIKNVVGARAEIHVIPNGITLDEIDHQQEEPLLDLSLVGRKPRRLLFLSRIHPKKGLDLLVPAWGRLCKEFPDWELLIVGPDEGGYQSFVEKMIASYDCSDSCWILPAVYGFAKRTLFHSAELFVLPSHSEGFPMVVLEAAAHRLPVVQTNECNFPELTAKGGAWQCNADYEDLCCVLRLALSSDDLELKERGALGRALVEQNYSWDSIATILNNLCLQIDDK